MTDLNAINEIVSDLQAECKQLRKEKHKLSEQLRKLESGCFDEPYIYSTKTILLGPGKEETLTFKVTREADFYATKLLRKGNGFEFQISDSSNDRCWSNVPIDAEMGAGSASRPMILPKPRFIPRASTVTVRVKSTSNRLGRVAIGLAGYKVFVIENLYTTA